MTKSTIGMGLIGVTAGVALSVMLLSTFQFRDRPASSQLSEQEKTELLSKFLEEAKKLPQASQPKAANEPLALAAVEKRLSQLESQASAKSNPAPQPSTPTVDLKPLEVRLGKIEEESKGHGQAVAALNEKIQKSEREAELWQVVAAGFAKKTAEGIEPQLKTVLVEVNRYKASFANPAAAQSFTERLENARKLALALTAPREAKTVSANASSLVKLLETSIQELGKSEVIEAGAVQAALSKKLEGVRTLAALFQ